MTTRTIKDLSKSEILNMLYHFGVDPDIKMSCAVCGDNSNHVYYICDKCTEACKDD